MPSELFLILGLVAVIVVVFVGFRRPMYECMAIGFLATIVASKRPDLLWDSLLAPASNPLFLIIVSFLVAAHVFTQTQAVDRLIALVASLLGQVRGAGGYLALVSSTFMAMLSGSGPANVAAVGTFTIPAMIKTGYSRALAATTEMSCSALGTIIPPSGTILLAFGVYEALYPGAISLAGFWLVCWGIGLWFIGQRWLTIYVFARLYDLQPLAPMSQHQMARARRDGLPYVLIPVIIFVPLVLDLTLRDWMGTRIGAAGAQTLTQIMLLAAPALAALYSVALYSRQRDESVVSALRTLGATVGFTAVRIAPIAATIYMAYSIAVLYSRLGVDESMAIWLTSQLSEPLIVAVFIPILTLFLGMVLPGTAQVSIFGGTLIAIFAATDQDPLLLAAMLPALTGALEGMTPPLALSMFIAMGIAKASLREMLPLTLMWVVLHVLMCVILLLGILPVLGMALP